MYFPRKLKNTFAITDHKIPGLRMMTKRVMCTYTGCDDFQTATKTHRVHVKPNEGNKSKTPNRATFLSTGQLIRFLLHWPLCLIYTGKATTGCFLYKCNHRKTETELHEAEHWLGLWCTETGTQAPRSVMTMHANPNKLLPATANDLHQ